MSKLSFNEKIAVVKMLISKLQKQNMELTEFARNARRIASLF